MPSSSTTVRCSLLRTIHGPLGIGLGDRVAYSGIRTYVRIEVMLVSSSSRLVRGVLGGVNFLLTVIGGRRLALRSPVAVVLATSATVTAPYRGSPAVPWIGYCCRTARYRDLVALFRAPRDETAPVK